MRLSRALGSLLWIAVALVLAVGANAQTGLNTIPTTDIVPLMEGAVEAENGNTSFDVPAFYSAPHLTYAGTFGLVRRMEAGVNWGEFNAKGDFDLVFNAKGVLLFEHRHNPGLAVGFNSIHSGQRTNYYVTLSKTINYSQVPGHHHRNKNLFVGKRLHFGLIREGNSAVDPFVGIDIEMNPYLIIQSDWINGSGNAATVGLEWTFRDEVTAVNPFLLFSNDKRRIDGFVLNISHQFSL